MHVDASIFKAYDIRGVVPAALNPAMAQALGRAFGTIARAQGQDTVAVGRDGRLSGPELSAALVRGLTEAGVDVIDIGRATPPMLHSFPTRRSSDLRTTTASRWSWAAGRSTARRFRRCGT